MDPRTYQLSDQEHRRLHLPLAGHGVHPRLSRDQRPQTADGGDRVEPVSTAAPMLKVNGHRTATIADLEHAEAVMGAGPTSGAADRSAVAAIQRRYSATARVNRNGSLPISRVMPPLATTAVRSRSVAAHAIAALTPATLSGAHTQRCKSGRTEATNKTPSPAQYRGGCTYGDITFPARRPPLSRSRLSRNVQPGMNVG